MNQISRRHFIKTAGIFGAATLCGAKKKERKRRPNIIFIIADDFGFECLSCNGSQSYHTPRIDHLAETGVRFEQAHATPLCTPTRVQLMTGKYNFRNYTEFGSLPPGQFTFANLFQQAGYKTCVAGKWQLAGKLNSETRHKAAGTLPGAAGFDEHCLWQVHRLGSRYWNPVIEENGHFPDDLAGRFGPDVFVDYITDFIRRHQSGPFFVYYPMTLTHYPFVPTPDQAPTTAEQPVHDPAHFKNFVEYADKLVGRILQTLDELNLRENTLVIFTGDNGTRDLIVTQTKTGSVRGGKGGTTIFGTHVPLIVSWPGKVVAGQICPDLVDFTDFFPTLADAAGIPLPADLILDGHSFLPRVLGQAGHPREWIFCHYDPRWGNRQPARFVHNQTWKLYDDGRIYDIFLDPREEKPVSRADLDHSVQPILTTFGQVLDRLK